MWDGRLIPLHWPLLLMPRYQFLASLALDPSMIHRSMTIKASPWNIFPFSAYTMISEVLWDVAKTAGEGFLFWVSCVLLLWGVPVAVTAPMTHVSWCIWSYPNAPATYAGSAVTILKHLAIFEAGILSFHFELGPTKHVPSVNVIFFTAKIIQHGEFLLNPIPKEHSGEQYSRPGYSLRPLMGGFTQTLWWELSWQHLDLKCMRLPFCSYLTLPKDAHPSLKLGLINQVPVSLWAHCEEEVLRIAMDINAVLERRPKLKEGKQRRETENEWLKVQEWSAIDKDAQATEVGSTGSQFWESGL